MRLVVRCACATLALLAWSAPSGAQLNDKFYYSVMPYFWFAGSSGQVGLRNIATNVTSVGDVSNTWRTGGGGYAEGRVKSYVLGFDATYFTLGNTRAISVVGDPSAFSLNFKRTMLQPSVGYTLGGDSWAFDLLASIRYWNVSADLDVDPLTVRVLTEQSGTRSWVDAVGGLRLHFLPFSAFRMTVGGDGGGGGARSTWQAYAGLGLDVASWVTVDFSYRGLGVNYDRRGVVYDVDTQGLTVAAIFRFLSR